MAVRYADIARQPVVSVAPTAEPVETDDLKDYLRLLGSDENNTVQRLLRAAREDVERDTQLAICSQTLILYLDCFPGWEIELRRPPVSSVTSIVYLEESAGASTTLSSSLYRSDLQSKPARITPAYNQIWPNTYPVVNSVTITFVAGYASAAVVPEAVKQLVRFRAAMLFENRGTDADEAAYNRLLARVQWQGF